MWGTPYKRWREVNIDLNHSTMEGRLAAPLPPPNSDALAGVPRKRERTVLRVVRERPARVVRVSDSEGLEVSTVSCDDAEEDDEWIVTFWCLWLWIIGILFFGLLLGTGAGWGACDRGWWYYEGYGCPMGCAGVPAVVCTPCVQ